MAINDIRYAELGYLALNVSDIPASREFYEGKVGLTLDAEPQDGMAFLRCSDKHHDIILYEGNEPGLKRVGWLMESPAALAALRDHMASLGIEMRPVDAREAALLKIENGYRMTEPTTGAIFEFYTKMAAAPTPYVPGHTKIMRLGHVVIGSPDRPETEKFLLEQLNFRASDRIDGMVTFTRCFPNPYHHSLGIVQNKKDRGSMHHVNFMVTEIDDIGKGNNRMRQNDVPIVAGIGRHPPSESVFLYFLDPDGLTVEYSFGMEEFPEEAPREPRNLPLSLESVDYWGGGPPDPRTGAVGAVETWPAAGR